MFLPVRTVCVEGDDTLKEFTVVRTQGRAKSWRSMLPRWRLTTIWTRRTGSERMCRHQYGPPRCRKWRHGKFSAGTGAASPPLGTTTIRRAESALTVGLKPFGHSSVAGRVTSEVVLTCLFQGRRKVWRRGQRKGVHLDLYKDWTEGVEADLLRCQLVSSVQDTMKEGSQ